jgi:hypothetical protein
MAKYVVKHNNGGFQLMIWHSGKNNYYGMFPTEQLAVIERDKILKGINQKVVYDKLYINNKELMYEILVSKAQGKLTNKAVIMFMKIVSGVNKKFRYADECDRQDVIAYSYEVLIKNWFNFEEEIYNNPFAYYTEVVKRAHAFQFKQLMKTRLNTISLDHTDEEGHKVFNI